MTSIVADAGPIIHLAEAQLLPLLANIGDVVVPNEVWFEVQANLPALLIPEFIQTIGLSDSQREAAAKIAGYYNLQKGESAALAFALDHREYWFLTDDSDARLAAESLNIEAHGSLGVVLLNVTRGHISKVAGKTSLDALRATTLWMSDRVWQAALKLIDAE